ncbi:50S ribosomal protein L29 [Aeriscardovia aeriphila]|uniref:Large ribosomal subunit protein uL29 n=1 Tax=Aeriscardovia aeriphila TaxID=218139 RepID=A0A261F9J5_9BIFI|nr:50S ribosomal protein L29 [Aeriscardovia aeriphila]MDO5694419.1 50S ribosomal protein L29 [Aeriscardovia aeriphila]NYI26098.1 large subunit ribosomal protein L29 [Aeriscardovia aeriphila]OZG55754.1 50S ribosomal protein L29 [Aeriscardovia aeriphila]HJF18077.1 50S ribosomal protein L29 [Aeriscardovia aeriphila]
MALGTKEYSIKALNEKTNAEIEEALKKSKEELFNLRFQAATSQLTNSSRLGAVKHDIARMYTVLRERELGITTEPAESKKSDSDKKDSKKADKAEDSSKKTEE